MDYIITKQDYKNLLRPNENAKKELDKISSFIAENLQLEFRNKGNFDVCHIVCFFICIAFPLILRSQLVYLILCACKQSDVIKQS